MDAFWAFSRPTCHSGKIKHRAWRIFLRLPSFLETLLMILCIWGMIFLVLHAFLRGWRSGGGKHLERFSKGLLQCFSMASPEYSVLLLCRSGVDRAQSTIPMLQQVSSFCSSNRLVMLSYFQDVGIIQIGIFSVLWEQVGDGKRVFWLSADPHFVFPTILYFVEIFLYISKYIEYCRGSWPHRL